MARAHACAAVTNTNGRFACASYGACRQLVPRPRGATGKRVTLAEQNVPSPFQHWLQPVWHVCRCARGTTNMQD
eukprot:6190885-Pleurochrysis_carterae.AAC.5